MRDSLTLLLLSQGPFFRGGCNAKKPLRSGDLRAHLLAVNTTGVLALAPSRLNYGVYGALMCMGTATVPQCKCITASSRITDGK